MSSLPTIEVFLRADPLEAVVISDPPVEVNQPIFQVINPGNFATAAQGELAESAVQPDVLALALQGKEDADPTILKSADIGDSVQPYNANTVIDSEYSTVKSKAQSALQPSALNNYETTSQLNARDTANRDRANHTGTQTIETITGLETALAGKASAAQGAKADTALQQGNNISLLTNNVGFITENIPDGARIGGVAYFCRATKPTARVDGSALVAGDKWYNPSARVDGFWSGTHWLGTSTIARTYGNWTVSTSGAYLGAFMLQNTALIESVEITLYSNGYTQGVNSSNHHILQLSYLTNIANWSEFSSVPTYNTFTGLGDLYGRTYAGLGGIGDRHILIPINQVISFISSIPTFQLRGIRVAATAVGTPPSGLLITQVNVNYRLVL